MIRKRKRVGVDVDGVLLDLLTPCIALASEMSGKVLSLADVEEWDLDALIPEGRIDEFWKRIGEPGIGRNLIPYPDALVGLPKLMEVADVYCVTSYLHDAVSWVHERDQCLYEHFKIPRDKMVHTRAKHVFSGAMLIDDKPKNIEEWAMEYVMGIPVLWEHPYNVGHALDPRIAHRVVRTSSWDEIVSIVKGL